MDGPGRYSRQTAEYFGLFYLPAIFREKQLAEREAAELLWEKCSNADLLPRFLPQGSPENALRGKVIRTHRN